MHEMQHDDRDDINKDEQNNLTHSAQISKAQYIDGDGVNGDERNNSLAQGVPISRRFVDQDRSTLSL
jgi:hypothetical protein